MQPMRQYDVFQVVNESNKVRVVVCNVCAGPVAELWGGEREANLIVASHALAHVHAVERAG